MNGFNSAYGTDGTRLDTCGACHYDFGGGGPRNWYGQDFENNNHDFAAIESIDSDLDGYLNSEEITALTLPGLACEDLADTSNAPADVGDYTEPNKSCGGHVQTMMVTAMVTPVTLPVLMVLQLTVMTMIPP
ncbi:MAG: hypothetical protein L0922_06155 [Candidatus Mariimomonas ferrooxydans]